MQNSFRSKKMYTFVVYIFHLQTQRFFVQRILITEYWDEIERGIELYSNLGKVFITGDMNGRTSHFSDILDFDKYIEDNDFIP